MQSTLNKSGGVLSTARPKSDVEWRIARAAEIPGPKYEVTHPDLTKMKRVTKDAHDLYRKACVVVVLELCLSSCVCVRACVCVCVWLAYRECRRVMWRR